MSCNKAKLKCDIFLWTFIYPCLFFVHCIALPYLRTTCGDIETNPGPKVTNIHIGHVNIRSIKSSVEDPFDPSHKIRKFELLSSHVRYYKYDIMGISETWLDNSVDSGFDIEGFHKPFRRDYNNHQRGIMVYVSESLPARRRTDLEVDNCEMICVEIQSNNKKILVCNCYRVQYYSVIDFGADMETLMDRASSEFDGIYVMGDMNARHQLFWEGDKTNAEGRALHSIFSQLGMTEMVHEPTRCAGNSQSCIDLIFTNNRSLVCHVSTRDKIAETCDHLPIFAQLSLSINKPPSYKRWVWDYKKGDYEKFRQLLLHAPWHSCFVDGNVDESTLNWSNLFIQCAEQCIPHYEATIRPRDKPFMNSEIRKLIKKRDSLRKEFLQNKDVTIGEHYRLYRNKVVSEIRKAKKQKENELDSHISAKLPPKKWWKLCKSSIAPQPGNLNGPLLDTYGNLVTESLNKAELLNDFFVSQSELDAESDSIPFVEHEDTNIIEPLIIMPEEVFGILTKLDANKASGPDGIGNLLLHEAAVPIAQPLTELFNFCLSLNKFPSSWKIAQVVPIFKKGDPLHCTNYRPISLLPCVSKVFERLLFDHIFSFLKSNKLLIPNQSGFIPGDSTVNQLMAICNNISSHLDKGEEVIGVFLDLTKAFDKVWHAGLKHKLREIGIRGQLFELLSSYLHYRKQFVTLNGHTSQLKMMHAGVPQGSVLGPLLFLIYINDITSDIKNDPYLFADDTSVLSHIESGDAYQAVNMLNCDLSQIQSWAKKWLICIHPQKTVAMLFSNKRVPSTLPPILLGDQVISLVSAHSHLGMTFTPTLSWTEHIERVSAKCYKILGILKRYKYRWTRNALETCYFSFVRPIVEYGSIIYDSCSIGDSNKLEAVQLEAARLVTGAKKGTSHDALYSELGWLTLKE